MNVDTASLESMCELIVDCPHSTPKWTDSGVVVLRNQNIRNGQLELSSPSYTNEAGYQSRVKRAIPQVGDIIFTREAPMGEVCLIPSGLKCCLGQRQVLLRPKETVNGEYLYWALQSPFVQHQISWNEGTGTTVSNVRIPVLKSLQIPRRGSDEQKIADALSSLAHKIRLNHQINQTLEQMAQAIFKSWFVDFEPVKAKIAALEAGGSEEDALLAAMQIIAGDAQECANTAEGSTPETAIGGKLTRLQAEQPEQYAELRATAKLFPSAMQDSELGEIPEGWSVSSIYEIADVVYGAPFKSKLFNQIGDGTPLIRIRDLKNERPGVRTPEEHPKGYLVQNGDLLVGMDGEFKPYIWGSGPAWMNQRVCCFKPKDSYSVGLIKGFIEPQLRELELTATATTVIHLGKGDINRFEFLNSGSPLLRVFSKITNSLIEQIIMNKSSTSTLEQLRNALLPKLLSGELSVSDAETWPEEAEEHANV